MGGGGGFAVASALKSFTLTLQFIRQRLFFWTFFTKTVARKTCCSHSYISRHLLSSFLINKYSKISHKEGHVLLTVCLEYYISQWSRCFACSLREKTNCGHEGLLNELVYWQDEFSAKLLKKISLNVHILNAPFSQVVLSNILEKRNVYTASSFFFSSVTGVARAATHFSSTTKNEGVSPRRKKNKSRAAKNEDVGSPKSLSLHIRPD